MESFEEFSKKVLSEMERMDKEFRRMDNKFHTERERMEKEFEEFVQGMDDHFNESMKKIEAVHKMPQSSQSSALTDEQRRQQLLREQQMFAEQQRQFAEQQLREHINTFHNVF